MQRFSLSRQFSQGADVGKTPELSLGGPDEFNPYDTTALHIFVKEAFPGALLLEEHQV